MSQTKSLRIGFSCPDAPGHLNPMIALASELRRRGHEVVFFTSTLSGSRIEGAGIPVHRMRQKYFTPEGAAADLVRLTGLRGNEALALVLRMVADSCRDYIEYGPIAIRETGVDALVLDSFWTNLNLVAMQMNLPFVHVSNALHPDYSGTTPFFAFDTPYENTPEARSRNLRDLIGFAALAKPCTDVTVEYAGRLGLNLDLADPYSTFSKLAQITQTPREFDFPGDHWPSHFHYTGPWTDLSSREPVDFPWESLTGEPLIYASLGTLANGLQDVYQTILHGACAPGRQVVLSVGPQVDPKTLDPMYANTVIVQGAPQLVLLERASLCITHAGLNTVLESLSNGVPLVAIPISNDQPGVAARIAYTGVGRYTRLEVLNAEVLRDMVEEVLAVPSYRENASRMSHAIARADGLRSAATLIEQAFMPG